MTPIEIITRYRYRSEFKPFSDEIDSIQAEEDTTTQEYLAIDFLNRFEISKYKMMLSRSYIDIGKGSVDIEELFDKVRIKHLDKACKEMNTFID